MNASNRSQLPFEHDPWETLGESDDQDPSTPGPTHALAIIPRPPLPEPAKSDYTGSGWTIPLLCLGLGLIACCVLIPQADANRRLAYDRQSLQADLASVKQQAKINAIFLKRIADDPALAERLAERQMKQIRAGTKVLRLDDASPGSGSDMSPFQITAVTPPPPTPAYQPAGGMLASLCCNPHCRLLLIGAALMAVAAGLVLGQSRW